MNVSAKKNKASVPVRFLPGIRFLPPREESRRHPSPFRSNALYDMALNAFGVSRAEVSVLYEIEFLFGLSADPQEVASNCAFAVHGAKEQCEKPPAKVVARYAEAFHSCMEKGLIRHLDEGGLREIRERLARWEALGVALLIEEDYTSYLRVGSLDLSETGWWVISGCEAMLGLHRCGDRIDDASGRIEIYGRSVADLEEQLSFVERTVLSDLNLQDSKVRRYNDIGTFPPTGKAVKKAWVDVVGPWATSHLRFESSGLRLTIQTEGRRRKGSRRKGDGDAPEQKQ